MKYFAIKILIKEIRKLRKKIDALETLEKERFWKTGNKRRPFSPY